VTGPDDTTPPSAADDTWPPDPFAGDGPLVDASPRPELSPDDCLDDDEPERTWPIIGSAT
jgi:hypothetical protein